jgi:general transcription factor 3C polypeptide 3 (transcription factor C subunit 4)
MEEFPRSKVNELENEFDGLMPLMECEGGFGSLADREGLNLEQDSEDSDSEDEPESQKTNLHAMEGVNEVFGPNVDQLWSRKRATGKNMKHGKTAGCRLPPEISDILGQANLHYASGDHGAAIEALNKVTRLAPLLPDPFHIMGLIYEESGDELRSLQFFVLAAMRTPKRADVWLVIESSE